MSEDAYNRMRQLGFSDSVYGTNYPAFADDAKKSLITNPVDMTKPSPSEIYSRQLEQSTFTKQNKKGGKTKRNRRKSKSRRSRK